MKTLSASVLGIFAAVGLAVAQMTVSERTTTAAPAQVAGTVTTFDPSGSIVLSAPGGTPVTYGYTKTTTLVDEAGNPVTVDVIKSGVPVTVYYSGDARTISKVVVRKAVAEPAVIEEKTTTTTTTK
ncbi:hypothetical protein BH09VER1_BH09VER1_22110 [soil metagenome]